MSAAGGPQQRRPRRKVDGVILVDKPTGLTSNAVLQRVRRAFCAEKAGHTGTLDPLASGLLPICFGEATKFAVALLDADKRYRAVIELGVKTETGDREGAVIFTAESPSDLASIEAAVARFRGDILQRPHRYSAIKRDGRPLYSYARAGVDITIEARAVCIHALDVIEWSRPHLTVDVHCSKGTYIRSLAEDIGDSLGCGAHVKELRRTKVAHLTVDDAVSLGELEASTPEKRDATLRPITMLVAPLPFIDLDAEAARRFLQGQRIALALGRATTKELNKPVAVMDRTPGDGKLLGLGTLVQGENSIVLVPSRVISSPHTA